MEREAYGKPEEETVEMFPEEEGSEVFEVFKGEEEVTPVSEELPIILSPVKEPEIAETIEVKEVPEMKVKVRPVLEPIPEMEELEIELRDLETLGQGILISEILGPPRAKKPFRKIH